MKAINKILMNQRVVPARKRQNFRKIIMSYLFLVPFLVFFAIFQFVPLFSSIFISFLRWDFFTPWKFAGLSNYKMLFDFSTITAEKYWEAMGHTLTFVVCMTPLLIILSFLLAFLVNRTFWGRGFFRSIFYFPTILSISTVAIIWRFVLDTNSGMINSILQTNVPWITQQPYAWISIFLLSLWWGVGGNMVLFLAALQDVPDSLIEASLLDGANSFQRIIYVILPSIKNAFLFIAVTTTLASFNVFGQPYMLTAGGPGTTTNVVMMDIYNTAFGSYQMGMATAKALILGLVMLCSSVALFRIQKGRTAA